MTSTSTLAVAPGSVVVVRDEEWLVTNVEQATDGALVSVRGLTELVKDAPAMFYEALDEIEVLDPAEAKVVGDDSPGYRRSLLWLESTLRKTPLPVDDPSVTVSTQALADPLDYQQEAVRRALDPANLRPRILLADAVGLGKTLEIGMILSELVRRGRGERILIVTPRHVLEQMQHEMWTRFALPFVRLDSVGIQRVRQQLPATRNPFSLYKRAIISIDTLKSERYLAHLKKHRWDAVVIDESHNITNSATQNNKLATTLAPQTDALILASATPHNGKAESFAELIRLLEPTAVRPDGSLVEDEVRRLVLRRHRHSPEVARVVGAAWAERLEPQNILVPASPGEDDVAHELADTWLHPHGGRSPHSKGSGLFPWTLAKAFLSSPAALEETLRQRIARLDADHPAEAAEIEALQRLRDVNQRSLTETGGKYAALLDHLRSVGVVPGSPDRVVVFAERIATLHWLAERVRRDLELPADAVAILHGGLSDQDQQGIVESFKQTTSPIRVLITGDVASEGVNLHLQCHELVHYDIPWSLIRLEQRNGRIDRYGQRHRPQITTLLLEPTHPRFSGDLRVLTRLMEKEHEAHTALGDVAGLMGEYDVEAEESRIREVLAGQRDLDDVVANPDEVAQRDDVAGLLARLQALGGKATTATGSAAGEKGLYAAPSDFLKEALLEVYTQPQQPPAEQGGGVSWREHTHEQVVELAPPSDLRRRLEVLPQSYLRDRRVTDTFKLATTKAKGQALLAGALSDASDSSWPEAHYLAPLHPVLDWVSDRALASLARNQVFAVRGTVEAPAVLLLGSLTNRSGHTVTSTWLQVDFPRGGPGFAPVTVHESAEAMLTAVGVSRGGSNPGAVAAAYQLDRLMPTAVQSARDQLKTVVAAAEAETLRRVDEWVHRAQSWTEEADVLIQRSQVRTRRTGVAEEQRLAAERAPDRQLVRPLLVVVPSDHPVQEG
ncbi:SNF2-related protein [uncultured Serinicoccus sp.]|uniref:SNF2-related protein n=1 Tax=uncultured Serinicoccus sp. TaxID=735514 RepID=UPI00262D2673|nr:SNF2-related protein [uncultured Serinicoccus sp.]